jgi:hypothetical protein
MPTRRATNYTSPGWGDGRQEMTYIQEHIQKLRDWLKIHIDYNVMISLYDFDNYEMKITVYHQGKEIYSDTSEDLDFLLQLAIAFLHLENNIKLIFLLYAESRERAKREILRHCKEQDWNISSVHTNRVTIGEDEILRIDNLV